MSWRLAVEKKQLLFKLQIYKLGRADSILKVYHVNFSKPSSIFHANYITYRIFSYIKYMYCRSGYIDVQKTSVEIVYFSQKILLRWEEYCGLY